MSAKRWVSALLLSLSGAAWGAPDGPDLYSRHCAACHGIDGSGGVGVPLALPAFLDSVPDHYIKTTIRLGRPGRVMPAFPQLTDAQVNAIVDHLRSWSDGTPPERDDAPVQGSPQRGAVLFAQHCASCHGPEGGGGRGTGVTYSRPRDLPVIAPALNNPGFQAAATDQMIKATLMKGRPGTPMPSFIEQGLTEQDINDVVAFVRSREQSKVPQQATDIQPTTVYESPYTLEETVANVKQAVVGKNFRVIREQFFDEGLVPAGQEEKRSVIIYFCNFNILNDALAVDPRVGLFLPCRVTVVEREGKVQVMAINPKTLSKLFNNTELDRVCTEMDRVYESILEEATL